MEIEFFVYGRPAPGGSKRAFWHRDTKKLIVTDACETTRPWMALVRDAAQQVYNGLILEGPIVVDMTFCFLRPKSHYRTGANKGLLKLSAPVRPTTRPDLTKLVRSTEDSLVGVIWKNDSQVVEQYNKKIYNDRPGVMIKIKELTPQSPVLKYE